MITPEKIYIKKQNLTPFEIKLVTKQYIRIIQINTFCIILIETSVWTSLLAQHKPPTYIQYQLYLGTGFTIRFMAAYLKKDTSLFNNIHRTKLEWTPHLMSC